MTVTGTFLEVKRFSVHDGPGVRTTLFLKGCSLRCRWCHNPESISPKTQLAHFEHKCINCGECVTVCPSNAHTMLDGNHQFDRKQCTFCGACEEVCLGGGLRLYGRKISVDEALAIAVEDRDFYGAEGGVTLSGGEPLTQAEFCAGLLKKFKKEGIHTAVDTCCCVGREAVEKVLPHTNLFLVDFKHADSVKHRKLTGQGNELIIENLRRLSKRGAKIEIRIPLIPGCNDSEENLQATGKLLSELQVEKVKVLPYHAMARSKYAALDMPDTMPKVELPDENAISLAENILRGYGINIGSGKE